ncbi:hypothetical protein PMAYCL1PPCAC_04743, partial [Pristionchus mayeri]
RDGLGMDTVYDNEHVVRHEPPRCMYVSSSMYRFNGQANDRAKGCLEKPSDLHSAGMDDGAGGYVHYGKFMSRRSFRCKHFDILQRNKDPLRIAAYRIPRSDTEYGGDQPYKKGEVPHKDWRRNYFKWRHYDHRGNIQWPHVSQIHWHREHPNNPQSDFQEESITMAVQNGEKIDLPPEVRAPAICSIWYFQQCENLNNPYKNDHEDLECKSEPTYQEDPSFPDRLSGFFTCDCPNPRGSVTRGPAFEAPFINHADPVTKIRTCTWRDPTKCAYLDFVDKDTGNWDSTATQYLENNNRRSIVQGKAGGDMLQQAVVHQGCRFTAYTYGGNLETDNDLVHRVSYGTYEIASEYNHKCHGEWSICGAISAQCWCP